MKGRENKPHIGIFGRRNNGKSSLINAIVGQEIAIVDSLAGTTTDPVKKSIEIFGIGPVVLIDTAGIDDVGAVGQKRIQKSLEVLKQIDLALLVISNRDYGEPEENLVRQFQEYAIPYLVVNNKCDIAATPVQALPFPVWDVSAKTHEGIDRLIAHAEDRFNDILLVFLKYTVLFPLFDHDLDLIFRDAAVFVFLYTQDLEPGFRREAQHADDRVEY